MAGATTSNVFYKEQMDFILLNANPPLVGITQFWIGLLISPTTASGAMAQSYTEVPTGVGYARMPINRSTTTTGGISGWQYNSGSYEYSNAADIVFGVPTANWGTIVGVGLFKTQTIGSSDMIYFAGLTSAKVVNAGDGAPKILAGQLRISRAVC